MPDDTIRNPVDPTTTPNDVHPDSFGGVGYDDGQAAPPDERPQRPPNKQDLAWSDDEGGTGQK